MVHIQLAKDMVQYWTADKQEMGCSARKMRRYFYSSIVLYFVL
jgi:hypothetical protein